jgi:methyl-accepting chemotaxis protein
VRDVIASYQVLINIFERIQLFLQRLKNYTAVQLTPDLTVFLGKLMAEILRILALSTKVMKERQISEFIRPLHTTLADHDTEKFMKRLVGRTDVDDALQRLNLLTLEENLMTTAASFQAIHEVRETVTEIREVVQDVSKNTSATRETALHINRNVLDIRGVAYDTAKGVSGVRNDVRIVNDNVQGARQRA